MFHFPEVAAISAHLVFCTRNDRVITLHAYNIIFNAELVCYFLQLVPVASHPDKVLILYFLICVFHTSIVLIQKIKKEK